MTTKNNLRDFTETDWDGFAGAETFLDRSVPLIGEWLVGGKSVCVVVSGSKGDAMIDVYIEDIEGAYIKRIDGHSFKLNKRQAMACATVLMNNGADLETLTLALTGFGFEVLGGPL